MSLSKENQEFVLYVVDLMQTIGPVYAKSMLGGHGIFLQGPMFALIADSTLYLKADSVSKGCFTEQGLEAFTYSRNGKPTQLSYFQAPEETLEDVEAMNEWANKAYSAAVRAASGKRRN